MQFVIPFLMIVALASTISFAFADDAPANDLHPIVLVQTSVGDFKLELNKEKAPITVKTF